MSDYMVIKSDNDYTIDQTTELYSWARSFPNLMVSRDEVYIMFSIVDIPLLHNVVRL